ncbi:MAG: hypothetical protein JW772_02270, partial [Candidatus Diapherotrites archaeon]|nr:hypothetical protein [Candidatus Diapherotrites archaeon]
MSKKEYHFKITENGIFCTNGGIREKDIFIEWKNIKGFFVAPTPSQFGGVLPLIKPLESIFGTGKEKRKKEIGTPINLLNQPMKQIKYSQLAGKLVGMVRTTPEVHEKVIQILNEKTKKGSPQNKKYSVI